MNKKVLRWNFVFQYGYILTNIFNAILLLPLYLKNIDAAALGLWLATGNILAWITTADPGVGDVLQQKIAELRGKNDFTEIRKTIGSGFVATVIILLIAILIGFGFYFFLGNIINKDLTKYPDLQKAFAISVFATGFSLVSFSLSGMNQGLLQSKQVAISSLLSNLLFLVINLVLLFTGFGVLSIALANLARALFLDVYNIAVLQQALKSQAVRVIYNLEHFRKFIRIFSFTSLSRIVTRVSENIDLVILARFIPAGMITVFEMNRRPVNIAQSLIGRHSVALMPVLSHEKGQGNRPGILSLISRHFKFYSYAVLLASFIFCTCYADLIWAWAGKNQYAGDQIVFIMVASFFFYTIGYFMSNVGYALGDIKMNSLISVVKGVLMAVLACFTASRYGITGMLLSSLACILVVDVFFYTYRLYRTGYFQMALLKNMAALWAAIIPAALFFAWASKSLTAYLIHADAHLTRFVVCSGLFTTFYLLILFLFDHELRAEIRQYRNKNRYEIQGAKYEVKIP